MQYKQNTIFVIALIFILTGCGSSGPAIQVDDAFQADWSRSVDIDPLGMAEVSPDEDYVLISPSTQEETVMVYNAETGEKKYEESPGFGQRLVSNISVGDVSVGDLQSDGFEYALLNDGHLLIFDYSIRNETMRGIDTNLGSEVWEQDKYSWTLDGFGLAADVAAQAMMDDPQAASDAGDVVGTALQSTYVSNLIEPVPGYHAFLFLTHEGLFAVNGQDGEALWHIEDFEGSALIPILTAPNGDLVVVSRQTEELRDMGRTLNIARIDFETGDVAWMSTNDPGTDLPIANPTEAFIEDDVLMVSSHNLQAFDLETGDRRANVLSQWDVEGGGMPPLATDADAFYTTASEMREAGDNVAVGGDDARILRINKATGEEIWSTEHTNSEVYDLQRTQDLLLVSAAGDVMDDEGGVIAYDAETGEERWRSTAFENAGFFEDARKTTTRNGVTYTRVRPVSTSEIVLGDGLAFAAGQTSVYALDLETGEVAYEIAHNQETDLGLVHRLVDRGDKIGVISVNGLAIYEKADGTQTYASESADVTSYEIFEDRIFIQNRADVSVIKASEGRELGQFSVSVPSGTVFGNLGRGFWAANEGQTIYMLGANETLARYQLR